MAFTVACAQFAPRKAEISANLDKIVEIVAQARGEGADLVLFPETSTTGYFLQGGVVELALTAQQLESELWTRIQPLGLGEIDVVVGFYENRSGTLYNSAAYFEFSSSGSRCVKVYRKFFLPTYGVFDEERYVSRGSELGVFESRFGRLVLLICEDVWHSVLPTLCALSGAQMLLVPSASPARGFTRPDIDNHDRYRRLFRAISEEHGVYCACAQLVGFEGGKGLVGGSVVVDPSGATLVEAPVADEALVLAGIDSDMVTLTRAQSPLLSDLQSTWADVRRLVAQIEVAP
jgi:N-carbamoylputrescine amidase